MKRLEKIQLGAILILGLSFRFLSAWQRDFWFDEAFTFALARQNLSHLLTATLADNHPPFYYLFLHFWMKFNQSEFFLRLPSIIFGLISIFLIYLVTQKLFDKKVASASSLILALSPLHVYFSAETRMYSLWTMLTLAGFYFFLKILSRPKKIYYLIFNILFLISLYTQYFTIFFLLSLDFFLVLKGRKYKKQLTHLFLSQVIIVLLFLPWAFSFLVSPHPSPWQIPPLIGIPATFVSFVLGGVGIVTLKTFFAATVPFLIKGVFLLASIFFSLFFLLGIKSREKNEEEVLLLLLIFVPILAVASISFFCPIYSPKPFLIFAPYFYILSSIGIEKLGGRLCLWTKILATAFLVLILFAQNLYLPFKPTSLQRGSNFLAENAKEQDIIAHSSILSFYSFLYYLPQFKNQHLVLPSGLPRQTTDIIGGTPGPISELKKEKRKIWLVVDPKGTRQEDLTRLEDELADYSLILSYKFDSLTTSLYSPTPSSS